MRLQYVAACMMLGGALAGVLGGCDAKKQEAIENARSLYESHLRRQGFPEYAGDANTPYLLARYSATVEFLASGPRLAKPYMVAADLWFSDGEPSASGMTIQWLAYDVEVVGIVLREGSDKSLPEWRLPVFAWEKEVRERAAGTWWEAGWRDTVARNRRVWVIPADDGEPFVRQVPNREGKPPVQLVMPKRLLAKNLVVAVYDEESNTSDFVPVFVWPGEPKVTE